ncbi:hypothetical protein EJ06DRAFT_584309 [Trichodelitschia bisporula]|uniref:RBR-type E3 ubiquitin transferase n=1 Tax=Trichodelitschia bisporula TaxID=703511 RepID=A0A6G1HND5_9PEZI|nr:hypothetical protein EJ06DRAFT_584309 [Trichodelitschia bisporula]
MAAHLHRCVVCHSRKPADEFPRGLNGNTHITITCHTCLGQVSNTRELLSELGRSMRTRPMTRTSTAAVDGDSERAQRAHKRKREDFPLAPPKKRKPSVPLPTYATCLVCDEEKEASAFPSRRIQRGWYMKSDIAKGGDCPNSCMNHLGFTRSTFRWRTAPTCKACITMWLTASLDSGAVNLSCPDERCRQKWAPEIVQIYLDQRSFDFYCDDAFTTWVAEQRDMVHCPKCNELQISGVERAGYPHMECASCHERLCVICKVPWHKDMTCQDWYLAHASDAQKEEEKELIKSLVAEGARRCPHCALAVVKDGGCPSMRCTRCRRDFWWLVAEPVRAAGSAPGKPKELPHGWHNPYPDRGCEADMQKTAGPLPPLTTQVLPVVPPQY